MRVVAAQHVGIAAVVEELRGQPDDGDGLVVGAVGEVEAAQPVIGGREPDPGLGVARMGLDGAAEIALGEPEIAGPGLLLAERQVVARIAAEERRVGGRDLVAVDRAGRVRIGRLGGRGAGAGEGGGRRGRRSCGRSRRAWSMSRSR